MNRVEILHELFHAERAVDRASEAIRAGHVKDAIEAIVLASIRLQRVDDLPWGSVSKGLREKMHRIANYLTEAKHLWYGGEPRALSVERYIGRLTRRVLECVPMARITWEFAPPGLVVVVRVEKDEKLYGTAVKHELRDLEDDACGPSRLADLDADSVFDGLRS